MHILQIFKCWQLIKQILKHHVKPHCVSQQTMSVGDPQAFRMNLSFSLQRKTWGSWVTCLRIGKLLIRLVT